MSLSLSPLLDAPTAIQIHAGMAMIAVSLGPIALYRSKRDRIHKWVGYAWVVTMTIACLSAFFISGFGVIGPFSPLHGLALFALYGIWQAMRAVFAGDIALHEQIMKNLFWRGVFLASLFNFLPGRAVNRILFNDAREWGYVIIALGLVCVAAQTWSQIRTSRTRQRPEKRAPKQLAAVS